MSKTLRKEYKTNSKKSLCKSKKEKKCKKIKGCKMTKGPKKTFCRKIRNKKYNKTKKTKGGGMSLGDVANMATKSPLGSQLKAEAEKRIQQKKEQLKAEAEKRIQQKKEQLKAEVEKKLTAEGQKILNTKIPIDESKLKAILNKLDEKKIKELMNGIEDLMELIKDMDDKTKNKIKSGDKEVIMKMVMQNPKLRALLIGKLRQELTKNPEMQKLAMEVMRSSMKGGDDFDRSENSVDALKRVYSNKNPDELNEIMMDPKESMESKRAAQQLIMEKI